MTSPAESNGPLLNRSYVGGYYSLALDGVQCGFLQKAEGGWATSDVIQEKVNSDHIIKKHIAGIKYSEFNLQMGLAMSTGVYNWIKQTFECEYQRKSGSVTSGDFQKYVRGTQEFYNALITEVTFPACDASSKDPAFLGIKFQPEWIKMPKPAGNEKMPAQPTDIRQKQLFPASFRFGIDGVKTKEVSKVDALTVKQIVVENPTSDLRTYEREPSHLDVPNLKITLADSQADDVWKWYDDFVIVGNNTEDDEKNGSLEYLDSPRKQTMLELTFSHMGPFSVTPDSQNSGARAGIRRTSFEFYVEEMSAAFFPPDK